MSTNGKAFLHQFVASVTFLRGIAGIDSYHLVTSIFSFDSKYSEELAQPASLMDFAR